jgi:hypothetical protein
MAEPELGHSSQPWLEPRGAREEGHRGDGGLEAKPAVVNVGTHSTAVRSTGADDIPGVSGRVLIGGALVAGGVAAFWYGVTLRRASDTTADVSRDRERARPLWCGCAVVLVVVGLMVVIRR